MIALKPSFGNFHPAYNRGCLTLVRLNSCGACNMLLNRIISKHAYLLSGSKRKVRCLLVHRNYNNSYSATLASTFSTSSGTAGTIARMWTTVERRAMKPRGEGN